MSSKFREKLDALYDEGKALRKWSNVQSTYIIYDGPYWGVWVYSKTGKVTVWKPLEWHDISGEYTSTCGSGWSRRIVKEPVVPCLLYMEVESFKDLARTDEFDKKKKLNVWYINKHREYTSKYMGNIVEWMQDLLKDNQKYNYYNFQNEMVIFLQYAQEAGYKWLKENPARIMSLSIINKYGRGYKGRKVLANYLLKYNSAKKALKKHYPQTPAAIINTIISSKWPIKSL